MTKDSSKTVVSQIATHVLYGAEASVNFTASVTSSNGEAIPAGEAVTIHVGSATCGAVTNGSGIATCSITNSALGSGSYPVSATYAGDSNIAGSTSTNPLSFAVWAKPTFTSANSTRAAVGQSFSFSVTATGYPTAMSYGITGSLPSGVSFNSSTGVLSGRPKNGTIGTYNVTITATNSAGSTNQSFQLKITAH